MTRLESYLIEKMRVRRLAVVIAALLLLIVTAGVMGWMLGKQAGRDAAIADAEQTTRWRDSINGKASSRT